MVVALTILAAGINMFLTRQLTHIENFAMAFCGVAFIVILATISARGPKLSASEVFETFQNDAGWPTLGLGMMSMQGLVAANYTGTDNGLLASTPSVR